MALSNETLESHVASRYRSVNCLVTLRAGLSYSPLVQLLDEREAEVSREACIALAKFAHPENYLRVDHSKAIIAAGGAKHLIQLTYFGEQIVQTPALVLLCCIATHVPDSSEMAEANVLNVLEWASKQTHIFPDEAGELLQDAKSKLELYQSRGSRGFPKVS